MGETGSERRDSVESASAPSAGRDNGASPASAWRGALDSTCAPSTGRDTGASTTSARRCASDSGCAPSTGRDAGASTDSPGAGRPKHLDREADPADAVRAPAQQDVGPPLTDGVLDPAPADADHAQRPRAADRDPAPADADLDPDPRAADPDPVPADEGLAPGPVDADFDPGPVDADLAPRQAAAARAHRRTVAGRRTARTSADRGPHRTGADRAPMKPAVDAAIRLDRFRPVRASAIVRGPRPRRMPRPDRQAADRARGAGARPVRRPASACVARIEAGAADPPADASHGAAPAVRDPRRPPDARARAGRRAPSAATCFSAQKLARVSVVCSKSRNRPARLRRCWASRTRRSPSRLRCCVLESASLLVKRTAPRHSSTAPRRCSSLISPAGWPSRSRRCGALRDRLQVRDAAGVAAEESRQRLLREHAGRPFLDVDLDAQLERFRPAAEQRRKALPQLWPASPWIGRGGAGPDGAGRGRGVRRDGVRRRRGRTRRRFAASIGRF